MIGCLVRGLRVPRYHPDISKLQNHHGGGGGWGDLRQTFLLIAQGRAVDHVAFLPHTLKEQNPASTWTHECTRCINPPPLPRCPVPLEKCHLMGIKGN